MVKKFQFSSLLILMILTILSLPLMASSGVSGHPEPVLQQMDKVEPALLEQVANRGTADYVVELSEKADLSGAEKILDWEARGRYVLDALKETAERTQSPVLAYLNENGLAYQSFIAGNEVMVFGGGRASIDALAALPEVSQIRIPRTAAIDPIESELWDSPAAQINSIAWGIDYAGANDFWSTFGFQGDGIVVANIDTGVQWDHPALDQSFKCGTDPSNPECWKDPYNSCPGGSACDNNGHGTHTMGTIVADDDPALPFQAGMAPNAQWIACKGCEGGSCSEYALSTCADWILAPDSNPSNRPHIVNNSWGGGGGEDWYLDEVKAWRAAGIFPAFSAGNSGPSCSTIGSPGDYQESFASGAHDSGGTIADSSSRGPSTYGHEPYTKPNIAAPGVSICSTVPGDGWTCGYSGTSMASPHSAGAVALLWSCNPSLIGDMTTTFELLQDNAGTAPDGNCGAPPDGEGNYTYGYGYLDVFQAGLHTCSGVSLGMLEGHVFDTESNPLEGATVTALSPTTTDANGYYSMVLPSGTYSVTASKEGYTTVQEDGVEIVEGMTTTQDFELTYIGAWQDGPAACFDWTRFDTEFFPGTGLIYALGGRSDSATTDGSIYSYDPETGACTDTGTDMPTPISNYTVNLINDGNKDLLCTFGGRDASANATQAVQCYDPLSNSVSVVTSLPGAYSGYMAGASVVYNNQVYLFGGFRTTAAPYDLARTDRYDPINQTFTQLGNLSLGRSYIYAAVVDGEIYAFGGAVYDPSGLKPQTRAEVMADPEGTGTWNNAVVADLPEAFAEGQAFGFDSDSPFETAAGKVVLVGGGYWPGNTTNVWTYDPSSNTYDADFPDLQYPRRNHAGVLVPLSSSNPDDGLPGMWVFGGYAGSDDPPYAGVEYYPLTEGTGALVVDPLTLDVTMYVGDSPHEETLTLNNEGTGAQAYEIFEIDQGYTPLEIAAEAPPERHIEEVTVALSASNSEASGLAVEPESAFPDADVILKIDDGSIDANIGIGGTWEFIWLNRFTLNPADYPFTLYEIQVYFSSSVSVGDEIVLVVYENTSGSTDPAPGSTYLYKLSTTVKTLDGWNTYLLPTGIPLSGPGDVLIGVITLETPGVDYYPAALDRTATQQRSWAGWWKTSPPPSTPTLPPNDTWMLIDDATFEGNWMIRGVGIKGEDVIWLTEDPVTGTVAAGDSQDVTVTFDVSGLALGEYQAELRIINPPNAIIQVPVSLEVTPPQVKWIQLFLPLLLK